MVLDKIICKEYMCHDNFSPLQSKHTHTHTHYLTNTPPSNSSTVFGLHLQGMTRFSRSPRLSQVLTASKKPQWQTHTDIHTHTHTHTCVFGVTK